MITINYYTCEINYLATFCTTNIVHLAVANTVSRPNKKNIVTLDIISPETENKHKTPNHNQKILKLNPKKSSELSESKDSLKITPKTELANSIPEN